MKSLFSSLKPLLFLLALHSAANAGVVKDHPGHWMGDLKLPDGRILKSGVELFSRADGSAWASFASPDQGAYDVPVKSMEEEGDTVELHLAFGVMKMTWVADHFNAEWRQGGAIFPIELTRVAEFLKRSGARRLQHHSLTRLNSFPSPAPMASPSARRCRFQRE